MEVLVVSPSAVGRASDAAVEWDGLVLTWQTVFVGRASGGPSGRGATGDTLRLWVYLTYNSWILKISSDNSRLRIYLKFGPFAIFYT